MRVWLCAGCLFVGLAIQGSAFADASGVPGTMVPWGTTPYSETWDEMRARGEARAAAEGAPGTPNLIREPRPTLHDIRAASSKQGFVPPLALPEAAPLQMVGTSFPAVTLADQFNDLGGGSIPPDTMGAIGPDHFLEVINSSVAVYDRSGTRLSHVSLDDFFMANVSGTIYPRNGAFDPRVLYDRRSERFFAIALERGEPSGTDNQLIIVISRTSDPTTTIWDKYVAPMGEPDMGATTFFTDFDTLGTDDNGVYFGVRIFPSAGASWAKLAATDKAPLLAPVPSPGALFIWDGITDMWSVPQPAHNHSAVGAGDRAWFVSSSTSVFGNVNYRTLTWSGGTPAMTVTSVLSTPAYADPPNAPASGSAVSIDVTDDRIQMAMIRNNRLWTCRHVGVNSSGGSSGANRTACEWLELNVSSATASLVQSGRVFDPAGGNPRFYYFPSIAVSGQGHAVMGFSGSKSTEFIGAYFTGRIVTDSAGTMSDPTLIKAGEAAYQVLDNNNRNRWGDYSFTSVDPNDDMTLWTIQEYATNISDPEFDIWGTWVGQLLAPPPVVNSVDVEFCAGITGVIVPITGANFYDPGPGYADRLSASVSGGGVTVTDVAFVNPANATLTVDVSAGAAAGPRDLTVTNPDGQSDVVVGAFTIVPTVAPDFDGDCDVDFVDLAFFEGCAASSGSTVPQLNPQCTDADLDGDGDNDQGDFGIVQRCTSGVDVPVEPGCDS